MKKSKSLLKYIVSLGLLAFIIMQIDYDLLMQNFMHFNATFVSLALILIICQIVFLNMRWHEYLNTGSRKISFQTSSLINITSLFANILFITSIGGIVAKSTLAMRCGLSFMHSLFATFLDRFMTLFALVILSAIGLPFLHNILDSKISIMLALSISGIICIVGTLLLLLRSGILKNYILSNRRRARLIAVLRSYAENYNLMFKTSLYSIMAQICFIMAVYALSLGMNNNGTIVHTIEFLALMPVLALISSLPISFGGWGVREGAFIYGLGLIGFSMESAFFLSVQVGLITLIAPFVIGIPYFISGDLKTFVQGHRKTVS